MALQFILGSARSGKTNFIYDQMIKDSMDHENEEFFFIVPDQSTLNAQKQLVTRHPRHGTFNIDVVGFFRLTYRVFEELSYIPKDLLEDEGKSMVIRKIIEQHKDDFKVFGSSTKKQGFIEELKSFFAEVYQYDISMQELEKVTDSMKEEGLRSKMEDIILVMEKFEDYIKEHYLISEQLLDVLAQKMEQSEKLRDATFYLDGFTGFTPIQRKVVEKLLKIGKNVYISLTLDGRYVRSPYHEYELFAMSKKEKRELIALAQNAGTQILPDIICWPDERDSKELRHLEQNIERYPYKTYDDQPKDIKASCFMNPRAESRMVANEIEHLVREKGYRYKDIVVLTADLESYQNELEKSFEDLHIPYFVDVNRKLLNNPCIETILSVLKMIQKDFSYDMVFRYLKSGFSNFTMEEADFLENYVLACGIRGFSRWNRPFTSKLFSEEELERVEQLRIRFIEEVGTLKTGIKRRGSTVKRKLIYLYEFLESLDVEGKMIEKQEMFEEAGDLLQARTYEKVYEQVIDLLEQMAEILGDEKLSYDDFLSVLESGLEEMQIGVIPPSLDQVVIGDMKRTRTEEVKILFFLGINEGVIPAANDGGGVVNDHQREILEKYGVALAPGAKQSAYMEQFYLYLTVSKPTDKLYLSYRMMDASGNNNRPSYFIERILRIFPKLKVSMEEESIKTGYTKEEALDQMITCLQELDLEGNFKENDDQEKQIRWMQTLYYALKELEPVNDYIDARFYMNQVIPLSKKLIHELYGDTILGSVTRMEKFAGCAFSHFMQYGLKLRKRLVHEILPTDMGKVFHKTMELVGKRSDWKFADDESRDQFVESMVENAVTEVQKELFESSYRNEYMLERMKRISKRAVWAMEQHIKRGDFTPEEYEIAFSEQNHLDSMTFHLEGGETMMFSGVVDRMDSMEDAENKYLKIIDYKSGNQKFDFAKIFHGLQMQLIIYMNAMMELYEKKSGKRVYPAGMFYFHLDDPIVESKYEDAAKEEILRKLKMSGVVNEDFNLIEQMEHTASEGFLTLPVKATKTGFDKRSSILNTTQLLNLGRFVEKKMTELGNSLMNGDISIRPYEYEGRKPCDYCDFRNVCAYEEGVDPVDKIKKVSLEEGKHALDKTTAESH